MKRILWVGLALLAILMATSASRLSAQAVFSTLTGVVSDASGARAPGASVKLINEATGNTYATVTDSAGYYSFPAVAVGNYTYKLTVEKAGFKSYMAGGLSLLGGQTRNLNVTLAVGSTTQTVTVTGALTSIVPVNSGEISQTLTTHELQNFVQVGSDAAEYLKIMPAMAIQNGTNNKANYDGEVIGINANGNGSETSQSPLNDAFTYYGLPTNTADILMDGAHVADPGCDCDTPVNPNSDFLSEMKVSTIDFSADQEKGPIVITTVTKSGTSQFHGSAFFDARNYVLNANDAQFNAAHSPKPQEDYYFPGFSFGGPIPLPGEGYNKGKNKLFFFTGFEYFHQTLDTGLLEATVPTKAIMNGDFSTSSLEQLGDANAGYITGSGAPPGVNCGTSGTYTPCLNAAALAKFPGGQVPAADMSSDTLALMKLYPAPNANPNTTGGYNYVQSEIYGQPDWQWDARGDYDISDSTKLFVRYNQQGETQLFPVALWGSNATQVPYPTPIEGKNASYSIAGGLTNILSPTMTNEAVLAYTEVLFPNILENPAKVDRTNVGYNIGGLFKNGIAQIPAIGCGGCEVALISTDAGGFNVGGPTQGLFANKYMPSFSDNLTKVIGAHTLEGGFYYEFIKNSQPDSAYTQGQMQFVSANNPYTTGDSYADAFLGLASYYNEQNFNRLNDISWNDYEFFAQDNWKVTPRLTVNYGMRFEHMQPWQDRLNYGYAIFDPSLYTGESCTGSPTFCGFTWHSKDPSVPDGGFPSRALFYDPRVGFAYDLHGNGKTVLRGGFAVYHYHSGQFTSGLGTTAGEESITEDSPVPLPNGLTQALLIDSSPLFPGADGLETLPYTASASSPTAVSSTDSDEPYTENWNFTISRQLPWSSLLQVGYIGDRSRDLATQGNGGVNYGGNEQNINLVPIGAMLSSKNNGVDPNTLIANNFRPYLGYSDIYPVVSLGWANYNSMEVSWIRTRGRYTLDLNYTLEKAMGLTGFYDQFDLADNYGVQPTNRTQLFNAAYSIQLPGVGAGYNRFIRGALNGWQLSGITSIQSGENLTGNRNQNFYMNLNSAKVPGTTFNISNESLLGTPDIQLNPILTCNPESNLGPHQFVNGNCFTYPTAIGQNGPFVVPPIYGPTFWDSDLGLFKNFKITESKNLQFRVEGYNFMNDPLWSFPNGENLTLSFDPTTGKSNNPDFGVAPVKQGHRIIELGVKFLF
jgi:Carboxypeptidase regulatory-like domain